MLFNTYTFGIFLFVVFTGYWLLKLKAPRLQNTWLLLSSYCFYSFWDYRFLFLLIFSTVLDFITGQQIKNAAKPFHKKGWLWLSIVLNVGLLGVFKYYNFFIESFMDLSASIGIQSHISSLNIILPVGISFYTFHGLSYVIDIYRSKIEPEQNWIDYGLFVSFFPLLVAGPIERATHLLPQLKTEREFSVTTATEGLRQFLWGLFKKVAIADFCAIYVNDIFGNIETQSSANLLMGAFFFAFQIYGDFSGYSDMAIGTAKLFNIQLLNNFNYPYFSVNIAEFWRRWHISLSSWFKDYVYIPLGGSKGSKYIQIRNVLIIFLLSGFWHGANWTFVCWGLLNALFFIPLLLTNNHATKQNLGLSFNELFSIFKTFILTSFAWILFRSNSLYDFWLYIKRLFSFEGAILPSQLPPSLVILILLMLIIEWRQQHLITVFHQFEKRYNRATRWTVYYGIILMLIVFGAKEQNFIYFQF